MSIKSRLHGLEKLTGKKPMTWREFIQSEILPPSLQEQWEKSLAMLDDEPECTSNLEEPPITNAETIKNEYQT